MRTFTSSIDTAVDYLRNGGIVALPTEGVYGLSCIPQNLAAVKRLCAIKERDENKGFVLVAADLDQLQPYIRPLTPIELNLVNATWPGPTTWVVPVKPGVSTLIHGQAPTIAVRVTAHPTLVAICKSLGGPIISTSANKTSKKAATSADQIDSLFSINEIDYILDAPLGGLNGPTEIRDLSSLTIIRPQIG